MPPPLGPPLGPRAPAVLGPGAAPSAGPVRVDAAQTPRPATSNPPVTDRAADAPLGAGLARAARPQDAQPGARLRALDAADTSDFRTIKHVAAATRVTPTSALFRLGGPDGLRLRPGEQVLLELPPDLASRPIYQAILEHRQVEAEKSAPLGGERKRWDPTPGLTALHFHATAPSEAEGWRYWHRRAPNTRSSAARTGRPSRTSISRSTAPSTSTRATSSTRRSSPTRSGCAGSGKIPRS
jgi:hypothetical protein